MRTKRILLVDDEPWSLLALKSTFDWKAFGCEIVAETGNPFEALKLLEAGKAEAAFVDIRMPGMTGLELIQAAKERGIGTEFVITSGYADFSYAQEALRQGVFDYLLKPVKREAAAPLLARLAEHLALKRRQADAERHDALSKQELPLRQLLPLPGGGGYRTHWQVAECACGEETEALPPEGGASGQWLWRLGIGSRTVLIVNADVPDATGFAAGLPCAAGLSRVSADEAELPRLLREARLALQAAFVRTNDRVIAYANPRYAVVEDWLGQIGTALTHRQSQLAADLLNRTPDLFERESLGVEELHLFIVTMKALLSRDGNEGSPTEPPDSLATFNDLEELFTHFSDLAALCAFLIEQLGDAASGDGDEREKPTGVNESFMQLLADVNRSYDRKLQLSELAARYHLNFTYCCDLFKRTTGKTFIQYVTDLRLQKAEKLLTQTELTIDLVTDAIGFGDAHYFTSVFKKRYGMTPTQFRRSGQL